MTKTFITTLGLAMGLATSAYADISWEFVGGSLASSGDANITATLATGAMGTGTFSSGGLSGGEGNYVDLGSGGTFSFTLPALSGGNTYTTLTVKELKAPGIYDGVSANANAGSLPLSSPSGTVPGTWELSLGNLAGAGPFSILISAPAKGAILDTVNVGVTAVPEPSTIIAGLLLLLPLGASTFRILRRQ